MHKDQFIIEGLKVVCHISLTLYSSSFGLFYFVDELGKEDCEEH